MASRASTNFVNADGDFYAKSTGTLPSTIIKTNEVPFSLTGWVKTTATGYNMANYLAFDQNDGCGIGVWTGKTAISNKVSPISEDRGTLCNDDNWHFIVGVFGATNHKLYLDGAVDIDRTFATKTFSANSWAYTNISSRQSLGVTAFDGELSFIGMYNQKALTINEVNELMWNPFSIFDGVVGLYPLNDSSNPAQDISGFGYDLTTTAGSPNESSESPPVFLLGGQ